MKDLKTAHRKQVGGSISFGDAPGRTCNVLTGHPLKCAYKGAPLIINV